MVLSLPLAGCFLNLSFVLPFIILGFGVQVAKSPQFPSVSNTPQEGMLWRNSSYLMFPKDSDIKNNGANTYKKILESLSSANFLSYICW